MRHETVEGRLWGPGSVVLILLMLLGAAAFVARFAYGLGATTNLSNNYPWGLWIVFDGNLVHSNIAQRFPSWAHYFLPTVQLHNLHHAQDRRHQDTNYSGSSAIWDVLFGTFSHPDRDPLGPLEIEGSPVPRPLRGMTLHASCMVLTRSDLPHPYPVALPDEPQGRSRRAHTRSTWLGRRFGGGGMSVR